MFKEKLLSLKPDLKALLSEGYSEERAYKIMNNEYTLKPKDIQNQYNSILLDFLYNYDLRLFRVLNVFFNDILRYVEGYLLIGGFDGGYLGLNEKTGKIYVIYADETNNIHEVFVNNELQFFEILLIFTEYSSKGSEDEIEEYLERCYDVCQEGNYDSFF